MKDLINKIKENGKVRIQGNEYIILSKTYYMTDINKFRYIKVNLNGHMILVISIEDDSICFGKVIENSVYEFVNDTQIKYENELYTMIARDYQRIEKVEFGDSNIVEGELEYTDYESQNGEKILSLTLDGKSDTLLNIIELTDIEFQI